MNLTYKYNRLCVRMKQSYKAKNYRKVIAKLNQEQLKVFNMVMLLSVKNSEDIKFDMESGETLIVLDNMLITISKYVVHIDNTTGFRSTQFSVDAYDIMDKQLNREAHRVRRKQKYEVKIRINNFLNKVINAYDLK